VASATRPIRTLRRKYASGAIPAAVRLSVEANFVITALDPGEAMLFIERQYAAPSTVTGKAVTLTEFPTRNCKVLTGP
jgi:hypothetical protein